MTDIGVDVSSTLLGVWMWCSGMDGVAGRDGLRGWGCYPVGKWVKYQCMGDGEMEVTEEIIERTRVSALDLVAAFLSMSEPSCNFTFTIIKCCYININS